MCILIAKPWNKDISKSTLKTCFENNSDGAGFAYVNVDNNGHKRLKVKKAMTFKKFWAQYRRATRLAPRSNMIIHFRIRTSGTIEEFNNHPFYLSKDMVLGHNGIISPMNKMLEGNENDTRAFCRIILKNLPDGWEDNNAIKMMVEDYIGYSKLATLDVNNKVVIFNQNKGQVEGGVWYSNSTYKRSTYSNNYSSRDYTGKVWLVKEKTWTEATNAYWSAMEGGYLRKGKNTNLPAITKDNSVFRGVATEDKKKDIVVPKSGDGGPVIDSWACEYCESTGNKIKYRKYEVDGFQMVFCTECADLLEFHKVISAVHLVSATQ